LVNPIRFEITQMDTATFTHYVETQTRLEVEVPVSVHVEYFVTAIREEKR
jgi:hypothetical protein